MRFLCVLTRSSGWPERLPTCGLRRNECGGAQPNERFRNMRHDNKEKKIYDNKETIFQHPAQPCADAGDAAGVVPDGEGGHTLKVNISDGTVATFEIVSNAAIQNLTCGMQPGACKTEGKK